VSHILQFRDATISPNFGICDTTVNVILMYVFFCLVHIRMDGVMPTHYEHGRFNIYQVKWLNLIRQIFRHWFYGIPNRGWLIFMVCFVRWNIDWRILCWCLAPWCGHCHQFSPIFESIARVSNVWLEDDKFELFDLFEETWWKSKFG